MKETLVTISKRTGFAISTVSRVLNGQAEKYRISRKTVELILAEARRCDYTPSLLAKGLRMKRTNTLGLLIPQVSNPYFADIASAIIREARSHGYTVMVVDTMENEENEQEGIRTMLSRRVDGIVAVPCGRTPDPTSKRWTARCPSCWWTAVSSEPRCRTSAPTTTAEAWRRPDSAAERTPQNRLHTGCSPFDAEPPARAGLSRRAPTSGTAGGSHHNRRRILAGERLPADQTRRGRSRPSHGDIRPEQYDPARRGQSHPRIGFADPRRYFRGVVRRQSLSGFSGSGHNPHGQPVEEIGKTAVRLLLESIREEVRCRTQLQLPPERIVRDSVANPRTAK